MRWFRQGVYDIFIGHTHWYGQKLSQSVSGWFSLDIHTHVNVLNPDSGREREPLIQYNSDPLRQELAISICQQEDGRVSSLRVVINQSVCLFFPFPSLDMSAVHLWTPWNTHRACNSCTKSHKLNLPSIACIQWQYEHLTKPYATCKKYLHECCCFLNIDANA